MVRLQRDAAAVATFSSPTDGVPDLVGGVNQAFLETEGTTRVVSAAVVMRRGSDGWTLVETAFATAPASILYVSGLLAFREAPAAISALCSLEADPAVVLVDGSGRLHP